MLEDIQVFLGLTHEELAAFLSLLEKTDSGSLLFTRENIDIRFDSFRSYRSSYSEISMELEVREDECTRKVKYSLPRSFICKIKRKKGNEQAKRLIGSVHNEEEGSNKAEVSEGEN
jgi:hypothetical protein